MSSRKSWYYSSKIGIPSLPIGPDDSMSESTVRSYKRVWGLGGTIAAKNGDPNVRGGKCSPTPNPNQAFKRGQWNSTGSPKGYSNEITGFSSSADLEVCEVLDESSV